MTSDYIIIQVKGVVQGVGFRYVTCQKAQTIGLTGYVRNLPHGIVEIVAGGEQVKQQALIDWLKQGGPNSARIDNFTVVPFVPQEKINSFYIRY